MPKLLRHLTLCTTYKILSRIVFNRLVPYAEKILGEYQGGFRYSRSDLDHQIDPGKMQ